MPPEASASSSPGSATNWAAILGRPSPQPCSPSIAGAVGRTILVTGAGGFIGSAMVRGLAASGARKIILLEIAEQQLFSITAQMSASGDADRCIAVLGSVCDRALLTALLEEHHPDLILHAAALKHVPLMERNPFAAVATNSLGTWRLAQLAEQFGVRHLILVSTDKAVAPHSIMGASKRIAELALLAHPTIGTAARLVNVIGSPCSVGPIFADQIARGGPVTVTHPAAQRFFLTLEEVVHLLVAVIDLAQPAGILIPDPGEPVSIYDLACRMIAASSRDVPIVFTEPRPGDKLDESVISSHEKLGAPVTSELRRVESPPSPPLEEHMQALEAAIAARNLPALLRHVQNLVPDYQPSTVLCDAVADPAAASR